MRRQHNPNGIDTARVVALRDCPPAWQREWVRLEWFTCTTCGVYCPAIFLAGGSTDTCNVCRIKQVYGSLENWLVQLP